MKKIGVLFVMLFLFCSPVMADANYPIETEVADWDTFSFDAPAGWEKEDSDLGNLRMTIYQKDYAAHMIAVEYFAGIPNFDVSANGLIKKEFTDEETENDIFGITTYDYDDDVDVQFSGQSPIGFGHCIETERPDYGEIVKKFYKIAFYDSEGYKVVIGYYYQDEPDEDILTYFKALPSTITLK